MAEHCKPTIEKIFWPNISQRVKRTNPEFAKIIDDLNPGNHFPLYLASYPFGAEIVQEGVFHLPMPNGKLSNLKDANIASDIQHDFKNMGLEIPCGMILKNSAELHIQSASQPISWKILEPGNLFAFWRKLDSPSSFHPKELFTLTAGARSIFMLPNISDKFMHKNLKRDFHLKLGAPNDLTEHWELFKSINSQVGEEAPWNIELLLFPDAWLDKIKHDKAWVHLHLYLLENAWRRSAYWRNKQFYDFAFSSMQERRNFKPNPYLADTVKHLLSVVVGAAPGFSPAIDESMAPIKLIQNAYTNSYGLKKYAPTLMHPKFFSLDEASRPVYYSMRFPTTLEFSPKSRKLSNTLSDLSELKHLMQAFISDIKANKLHFSDTAIGDIVDHIEFDFFHNKPDPHDEIKLTDAMPNFDDNLLNCQTANSSHTFAEAATFVRGCVRISAKNEML